MSEALKKAMDELVPEFRNEPRHWGNIIRRARVDRLRPDRRRLIAYPSPKPLELPFDFYVVTTRGGVASSQGASVRALIAFDRDGNVIGRERP